MRQRVRADTGAPMGGARGALLSFLLVIALAGCSAGRPNVPQPARAFDLHQLAGTWHVIESNFPLWTDGEKTDPAFHYRLIEDADGQRLDDTVSYREDGDVETIRGTDTPDPEDPSHFTWRGNGILCLFTSDWYVVMRPADDSWAVLYFSSTWVTPEGVDIIARAKTLPPKTLAQIRAAIAADAVLREKAAGLRPVR